MFGDIGWTEMLVIGVVALIVIGPQDLPDMFRQIGRFTGKLRQMARDFQRAMDQAAHETGVKDVARDVSNLTSPKAMGLDAVRSAADKFEKWDPLKNAAKPTQPIQPSTIRGPAPDAAAPETPAPDAQVPDAPAAAPAVGPATQAQYDKQAARSAILRESSEKLKALDAADAAPAPAKKPRAPRKAAAPAAETAAEKTTAPAAAEAAPKKPRAPRKKKTETEE